MAKPSKYQPRLWTEIIDRLSRGEPLAQICRDEHMPAVRTVSDWSRRDERHSTEFARARDDGFDAIALDALLIADDPKRDTAVDEKGFARPDNEWIQRTKLRVETRLKLLAKWDPKRYGDRVQADISNPDGTLQAKCEGESAARIASMLAMAAARQAGGLHDIPCAVRLTTGSESS